MQEDSAAKAIPAVHALDLSFDYPGRRALDEVSFEITAGEIFGFLGPNGSGKSTLFRILATLTPPQEGRAEVLGFDLAADPREVRRRLGVVFQSPSLDPHLTVGENLLHQGHLYGVRGRRLEERIAEALERFELSGRRQDKVKTLSGGLARRVEIAKALLHRPRLLLLDEPSTGLDPRARRQLFDSLEALAGDGVTVLTTTHFMEEGDRCHRLALLDEGRIVALGSPDELKREIGGDVVTLSAVDPEGLAAAVRAELSETVEPQILDGTVRFEHDEAHALLARLAAALPGEIDSMTVARPTLEDLFLRRTGRRLEEI